MDDFFRHAVARDIAVMHVAPTIATKHRGRFVIAAFGAR